MEFKAYVAELAEAITEIPEDSLARVLALLRRAREEGNTVFVFGNGGSAATANHLACDLGKNTRLAGSRRLRVISLADNVSVLSAYANDEGYESVFAEPLRSLAVPGDVAVAISASGNSPNVLSAVAIARELGLATIGMTGCGGGALSGLVDISIVIPCENMGQVESAHTVLGHFLTFALGNEPSG